MTHDSPERLPQRDLETRPQPNVENLSEPVGDNEPASDFEDHSEPVVEDQPEPNLVIQPISRRQETIVLPDYIRAVDSGSRCIIEGCQGSERFRLPLSTRKMLLLQFNYYVPVNSRVCSNHLNTETWDFQAGISAYSNAFNATHIQDMLHLKSTNVNALDFSNINNLEDHLVRHWNGYTKDQLNQLLNEIPTINEMRRGKTALAAFLMKLRTGEPNERLASLFQIPRRTLEVLMAKVQELLLLSFIPTHLGVGHITREQIIQRNLLIPRGLFGVQSDGQENPIVIADGSYCYIQKSSNYLYQKNTYSLHKYRNLVKPFMLVCSDGYIIDVLGPYPATTSDAAIMLREFENENSYLCRHFQEGDAFVLDRGFRDALPLLNACGYKTHFPASLQRGETQLSTLAANKSRSVTISRWVVEAVNGRFKRDFKLFRQEYFNLASKHVMIDFKIAAALINRFHPPITNRNDAGEILNIINANMFENNYLSDFVNVNQLNRRRADFVSVTVENDNLTDFPRLSYSELILISLGTYQIKQSRSYYGEHVRANGTYIIEVCREVDRGLLEELSTSNTLWILRGRIRSRHVGRKIYFVYILIDSSLSGREAIKQYCCNCIVGRRTVGCCAHIMSIIWYLAWARHQDSLSPPAPFLDNILLIYDHDHE